MIDENSNGSYDDPEDVVVFDLDGDGALEGGHEGRERRARHQPFLWAGEWLRVTDVDPVARSLRIERARRVTRKHMVLNARSGKPLEGVRVTSYPGGLSAVTDRRGQVAIDWPKGPVHFVTAVADGYWSAVSGTGESAARKRILLEPAETCRGPGIHWCGRETLPLFAMPTKKRHGPTVKNRIDLDSGVRGPRVGGPPGPEDLGWIVHSGAAYLEAFEEAGLSVLGTANFVDFEGISRADLRSLALDRRRVDGGPECRSEATGGPGARITPGTVLGVRTREGRLGKIRIDDCGHRLDLSWVIYDEGSPEGAAADQHAPLTLVSKTPVERPVQVGGGVVAPVKLYTPQPQYTRRARQARLQGVVIVQVIIDRQGKVTSAKVLKGLGMGLDQSALKTLRKWRFEPATLNGEPVAVFYNLTVNFRLSEGAGCCKDPGSPARAPGGPAPRRSPGPSRRGRPGRSGSRTGPGRCGTRRSRALVPGVEGPEGSRVLGRSAGPRGQAGRGAWSPPVGPGPRVRPRRRLGLSLPGSGPLTASQGLGHRWKGPRGRHPVPPRVSLSLTNCRRPWTTTSTAF